MRTLGVFLNGAAALIDLSYIIEEFPCFVNMHGAVAEDVEVYEVEIICRQEDVAAIEYILAPYV